MTLRKMLLLALVLAAAPVAAQEDATEEESAPKVDPGLLGEDGKVHDRLRLDPQDEASLINKPRIAEQTMERLKGLQEAGNPHIKKGLLLQNLQVDPELSKVDTEKLHDRVIRLVETHSVNGLPEDDVPGAAPPPVIQDSQDADRSAPSAGTDFWNIVLAVIGVGCLTTGTLVLALKR